MRSNQWVHWVYDRGNVPRQVERLFEITSVSLEWFVPQAKDSQFSHAESGGVRAVARDVPVAVLAGHDLLQVLDMRDSPATHASLFQELPYSFRVSAWAPWESIVVSPDGKLIVLAISCGVLVVDWKAGKPIWQKGHLEQEGRSNNALAFGGDKGQFLFVAGAHTVERWDLPTGRKLATLATNQPVVKLLTTSRDGRVLLAGFSDDSSLGSLARTFAVWEADKDQPLRRFVEPGLTAAGISPDGQQIALSRCPEKGLVIYNWQTDQRKEVPLRLPSAASAAYRLYWAPDGKRVAAVVNGFPPSVFIYDASTWKPIAQWNCLRQGEMPSFSFTKDGVLLQLRGADLNALDVSGLPGLGE